MLGFTKDYGLTQTKLCKVLDCSQQAYSDYECGKRGEIIGEKMCKLHIFCKAFHI